MADIMVANLAPMALGGRTCGAMRLKRAAKLGATTPPLVATEPGVALPPLAA